MTDNILSYCCIAYLICFHISFLLFREQRTALMLERKLGIDKDLILKFGGNKFLLLGKLTCLIGYCILGYLLYEGEYIHAIILICISAIRNFIIPIDSISVCASFVVNLTNSPYSEVTLMRDAILSCLIEESTKGRDIILESLLP